VVFLDEPTAGVDPEGRITVREVVGSLRSRNACVVLTTHELTEAERLADRMVVMARGTVIATGTAAELAHHHGGVPAVRFSSRPGLDVVALAAALGCAVVEIGPGSYRFQTAGGTGRTAALAGWLEEQGAPLLELRSTASLEETYLSLVGREASAEPAETGRVRRER
jgi:ABC-2 type transport system ATP-binding protein